MAGEIYHPTYLIHPETKRILTQHGHKVEFDPVLSESEYRSYKREFLDKRPEGEETPIISKVTSITRMRSADHRFEFLVWNEKQHFIDSMKNEIPAARNYCGIYKTPKFRGTTTPDGEGGLKTVYDIVGWNTLFEIPFNPDNAKKLRAMADNEFELKTDIATYGNEADQWTLKPEDWDKWLLWKFDALVHYCRTPLDFKQGEQLSPLNTPAPDITKNERFSPEIKNNATQPKAGSKK